MTNSADPDQLASSEANWSGSTLFAKTGHVLFSKRRVKFRDRGVFVFLSNYMFNANNVLLSPIRPRVLWHLILVCTICQRHFRLTQYINPKWFNSFENVITKTRLFKYIENFTSKNIKFSDKKILYFSYFCSKHRLWVLVRTASARRF